MLSKNVLQFVLVLGLTLGAGSAFAQRADRGGAAIRGVAGIADDGHAVQTFAMPAGELTLIFGEDREIAAVTYKRADGRVSMEIVDAKGNAKGHLGNAKHLKNDVLDDEHTTRCIQCYDRGTWGIWAVYDKDGVLVGYLIIDKDGDVHFSPKKVEK